MSLQGTSKTRRENYFDVIVVGGGIAGLSAAIYLGRAKQNTLIIDANQSMARWEPEVQNYLGFPQGISGKELLSRGIQQARKYGVKLVRDKIVSARKRRDRFYLRSAKKRYFCGRLLLATGILHVPPEIVGVNACLGRSMFFCKDCDGHRMQGQKICIYGWTNEAAEYALEMLTYSSQIKILTNGRKPTWERKYQRQLQRYKIPVHSQAIMNVCHKHGRLQHLLLKDKTELAVQALFTTRGDVYFNHLAKQLGAAIGKYGDIEVDSEMNTRVKRLYAAGCVTPANCQMIIAAGQGAAAAQTINRDIFEERLKRRCLPRES